MLTDISSLEFYNGSISLQHPRLYSLQDALSEAYISNLTSKTKVPLYSGWWSNSKLVHGGCYNKTTKKEDCSSVCRDSTQFFTDATTIHNCAVFWRLQELGCANSTISNIGDNLKTANDMGLFTATPITGWQDGFLDRNQSFPGLNPILQCLSKTCVAVTNQDCQTLGVPILDDLPASMGYYDICDGSFGISDNGLNSDVGGIGVSLCERHM